jgi:hypothetical protein
LSTPVTGTFQSETLGWDHHLDAGILVVLPVTFVVLLSIIAVAASVNCRRTRIWPRVGSAVQSRLILPILCISSAGHLGDVLGGFDESGMADNENVYV